MFSNTQQDRAAIAVTLGLCGLGLNLLHLALPVRADEPPLDAPKATPFQRRDSATENELLSKLAELPEIDLTSMEPARGLRQAASDLAEEIRTLAFYGPGTERGRDTEILSARSKACDEEQLKLWRALGLSARGQKAAQISPEAAKSLEETAGLLRRGGFVTGAPRNHSKDAERERESVRTIASGPAVPEKYGPAFIQLLQVEEEEERLLLTQTLSYMNGTAASKALAERALYDTSPAVREKAAGGLEARPREEYRAVLLAGFRFPLPFVADHAAEALVFLRDRDAVPALKKLESMPDPSRPFPRAASDGNPLVREVIRINHLRNCLLCHAPSLSRNDPVVAPIPTPREALPGSGYNRARADGLKVRADVTYLRPDFSVMRPVKAAAPWPRMQRFDFIVRTREATPAELEAAGTAPASYPQRQAVLWAIDKLQRQTAGPPGK